LHLSVPLDICQSALGLGEALKSYDLSALNILVLEKHLLVRRILTDVFSEFGVANVYSTPEIKEAYKFFAEMEPDIVLCDWTPDLNGIDFIRKVRMSDDSPNPYVPIVVVTANTELRHVCIARDNGMTEFLAKPVSAKTIYSRLCSLIENPRPFVRVGDFFGPDRRRRKAEVLGRGERRKAM
jgi:two-component system chemotaxis response regulator CheY